MPEGLKTIYVVLTDQEHEEAQPFKGSRTWKKVLLDGLKKPTF